MLIFQHGMVVMFPLPEDQYYRVILDDFRDQPVPSQRRDLAHGISTEGVPPTLEKFHNVGSVSFKS